MIHPVVAIFDARANAQRRAELSDNHHEMIPLIRVWKDSTEPGHVYFLAAPELKRIKIGFTRDVQRRFASLQNSSPCDLVLLGSVRGVPQAEEAMHLLLLSDRAKGEWFHATTRVLGAVEVALRMSSVPGLPHPSTAAATSQRSAHAP